MQSFSSCLWNFNNFFIPFYFIFLEQEKVNQKMKELNFQIPISEKAVNVRTLSLDHAVMVWVGESTEFNKLNIASISQDSKTTSSVDLIGESSLTMSQKLSKKLKKQVLLSFNVPEENPVESSLVEDMILKGIINRLALSQS